MKIFNVIYMALLAGGVGLFSVGAIAEKDGNATAIFAGGCFWCTEADFEKVPGVIAAKSGYVGGRQAKPTYKQVSSGRTGHTEAVQVSYDPGVVSYQDLLKVFWYSIDPLAKNAQFCDKGAQYRTGIYYLSQEQEKQATASKLQLQESGQLRGAIATEIVAATRFWPAEDYHQDYYKKNALRYKYYRFSCGREARLEELWGDKAGWTPAPR